MQILYLGCDVELLHFMEKEGDRVYATTNQVNIELMESLNPEMIISYNYRYILPKEIIDFPSHGAFNLHISYLPFNRGADPNIWSHIDGTPKGVTIHVIDKGIDTGDIVAQRRVRFKDSMTLKESWEILQSEIRSLFKLHYPYIKDGIYMRIPQENKLATFHKAIDRPFLPKGYETTIGELKCLKLK